VLVKEGHDLSFDAREERTQQEADIDADLDVVGYHRDVAGGPRTAEP